MTNVKYKGKLGKVKSNFKLRKRETLSIKLPDPKAKMYEYEKNLLGALNEMTIVEQVSIAMNSLSRNVEFKVGNHTTLTEKLVNSVKYQALTLEEVVKLKAYVKTYFGKINFDGYDMSHRMNFQSKLSVDGKLAFINITFSHVQNPEIKNVLLLNLPIPGQLMDSPKVVISAYFLITYYFQVLLSGEI